MKEKEDLERERRSQRERGGGERGGVRKRKRERHAVSLASSSVQLAVCQVSAAEPFFLQHLGGKASCQVYY